jgi:hypothetical protein
MSEPADLDALARRYLDLWQDQMTALAGDEEFAKALQQLTTAMGVAATAGPAAWAAAWPGMMAGLQPPGATERKSDEQSAAEGAGETPATAFEHPATDAATGGAKIPGAEAAPGAAAAAAPPRGGGDVLEQLARRLAALEERIAALEGGAPRRGRSAPRASGKRRS